MQEGHRKNAAELLFPSNLFYSYWKRIFGAGMSVVPVHLMTKGSGSKRHTGRILKNIKISSFIPFTKMSKRCIIGG